ncbi:hypothetical protein VTK73DRAFT_4095 [Phialemonium thermophilum]|uniref:Secreted protein n=1 Tax=Phialemonium thermophilum TaxID=223376 RepID=A0ABR3VBX2_9PEZI
MEMMYVVVVVAGWETESAPFLLWMPLCLSCVGNWVGASDRSYASGKGVVGRETGGRVGVRRTWAHALCWAASGEVLRLLTDQNGSYRAGSRNGAALVAANVTGREPHRHKGTESTKPEVE